ncbi:hypothetical protein ACGFYA_20460 [Streptomyces sp. NPDC048305]|uniref:hypothetical protein n=1 Tax=Streptomyces sp. NPDC048305 TaxID=3365532 RepID=UPI0037107809
MENHSGVGTCGPDGWQGKGTFTSQDGLIVLSVDYGDEDFHIDAKLGHSPADMRTVLAQARARGLEPMDADECEPEILEDSTIRIYLVLADQPAPEQTVSIAEIQARRRQSSAKRVTFAFALAVSVAAALFLPSPLRFDYIPDHDRADSREIYAPTQPTMAPTRG